MDKSVSFNADLWLTYAGISPHMDTIPRHVSQVDIPGIESSMKWNEHKLPFHYPIGDHPLRQALRGLCL